MSMASWHRGAGEVAEPETAPPLAAPAPPPAPPPSPLNGDAGAVTAMGSESAARGGGDRLQAAVMTPPLPLAVMEAGGA